MSNFDFISVENVTRKIHRIKTRKRKKSMKEKSDKKLFPYTRVKFGPSLWARGREDGVSNWKMRNAQQKDEKSSLKTNIRERASLTVVKKEEKTVWTDDKFAAKWDQTRCDQRAWTLQRAKVEEGKFVICHNFYVSFFWKMKKNMKEF